jgi:endonuclease/exonuclease/phosphatase (EEP) superfamily protein YafD
MTITGLLSASLVYRLIIVFPYTRLARNRVPASKDDPQSLGLKIISANVRMKNTNHIGLLQLVRSEDPDILFLVETDKVWKEAVHPVCKSVFPHHVLEPLDNTYGMILYSKYPFSEAEIRYLVEKEVPSIHAVIEVDQDTRIRFFGIHPKPPIPSEEPTSLPRDAELILVGREARKSKLPVIIGGDLNDVAWSHTTRLFLRISELLDPRMGRGFFNTYHAHYPVLRWPLDHLFVSRHFHLGKIRRLDNFDSDHFPIGMELFLEPHNGEFVRSADLEDRQEADDKLNAVI